MAGIRVTTAAGDGEGQALPARQIGPYELLTFLGRGTSAVVLLARRAGIERLFALKLLGPNLDPEGAARVRREAQVASRLDHPGIVRVVDTGTWNGQLYLVMDHIPGPTLQEKLGQVGRFRSEEACGLALAMAEALAAAHAAGVVHRDLKPANVIIDGRDGRPKVTDFGLARDLLAPTALTQDGAILGTPFYMAPEQLKGAAVDPRADVYALGVILYELLTGQRPYDARNVSELGWKVLAGNPPRPSTLVEGVLPAVEAAALTAMAVDPTARPADAGALAELLRAALPPPVTTPADDGPGRGSGSTPGWSGDHTIGATSSAPSTPRALAAPSAGRGAVLAGALLAGSVLLLLAALWARDARGRLRASTEGLAVATAELEALDAALSRDRAAQAEVGRAPRAEEARAQAARERAKARADAAVAEAQVAIADAVRVDGPVAEVIDVTVERLRRAPGGATLRATLLRNRGRVDEALQVAREAIDAGDTDLDLLVLAGRSEVALGRLDAAAAWFRRVEQRAGSPDEPEAVFARLARTVGTSDGQQLSIPELQAASARRPDWHPLHMLVARALRLAAKRDPALLDEAVRAATRAIETDPTNPDAWGERALARLERLVADPTVAQDVGPRILLDLRRARAVRPDPDLWSDAGVTLVFMGHGGWAAAELEEARSRIDAGGQGDRARASLWLGHARALAGDEQGAVAAWREGKPGSLPVATAPTHARWFGRVGAAARARALESAPALREAVERLLPR